MQPTSKELQGMASMIALEDLHNGGHDPPIAYDHQPAAPHDDFFDQMLSTYPSWPASAAPDAAAKHLFNSLPFGDAGGGGAYDESALLASRLRLHQISGSPSPKLLSQNMLSGGGESGLAPLPLTLAGNEPAAVADDGSFRPHNLGGDMQGLYNGFNGSSLPRPPQMAANQHQQQHDQNGSLGSPTFNAPANQAPASGGGAGGGPGNGGAPRQRVRARRGQATDPHSIAERLRRERIAERMKALQELVPNANKTDKASMLDEIIDYVKFLQLQVKVLSMSRLGGAAAVAPLVADNTSQAAGGLGRGGNGAQSTPGTDSLTVTEHQVAKLMEEDMGSAMQYLQGKGLCLMPISLASAISSATRSANPLLGTGNGGADAPPSPSMSVLTVQSAIANNGCAETSAKDAASVSKP